MISVLLKDAVSTGVDPTFDAVQSVEIEDTPFGEGAFGKVYRCISVNGMALLESQAVKVLLDDGTGSHERGLRTIRILQERLQRKIQTSGRDAVLGLGALEALPQFSFRGAMNGKSVTGYSASLLPSSDWVEFGDLFNAPDLNERKRLHDRFYNLPLDARLRMSHELVQAFALLQGLGFIYADLNPKNFFVDMDRARLCLIDFEGGAVNEAPETFGKMGEWLAPEVQSQLLRTGSGNVQVDLNTDTWAVAIAIHFLLFPFHPVFFLAQRGDTDMQRYFANTKWPDADQTDPNFREPAAYAWYRKRLAELPLDIIKAFDETLNQGWYNRGRRLSYTQWERVIAGQMKPPEVQYFTVSPATTMPGLEVSLKWLVDRAIKVEIDNGVGDVTTAKEITLKPVGSTRYTLKATGHFGIREASAEVGVFPTPIIQSLIVPAPEIRAFASLTPIHISAPRIDLHVTLDQARLVNDPDAFATLRKDIGAVKPMHGKVAEPGTISRVYERIQRMVRT